MSGGHEDGRWFRALRVPEGAVGWRVDTFLSARFSTWSRTSVQSELRAGNIRSTRRRLKPASRLELDEELRIFTAGMAPSGPPPGLPQVLHEDDRVLVVNKPAGLLVHPAGDQFAYAVIGIAKTARPDDLIDLCHRLDRDTSGVLVLTKDLEANAFIKSALNRRDAAMEKTYLAIVRGPVPWQTVDVRAPIGDRIDSEVRLRRGVVEDGKSAHTTFRRIQQLPDGALVACTLHTGRTHQIRVHLEHIGHPLLGDKVYGQPDDVFIGWNQDGATDAVRAAVRFPRHCLHAWRLRLPHPDGTTLSIEAPLTADLQALVDGAPPTWPSPATTTPSG